MPPGLPPGMRPPGSYPPGQYPGYPPRRGGLLRALLFCFILLLLGVSVIINLVLLVSNTGGKSVLSNVVSSGDSHKQIAIIPLEGLIDAAQEARFDRYIEHAQGDSDVKAIIIQIDTPGGSVSASDEIYKRIKKFKADRNVPVVVAMRAMATSGGYYAACACDYIVAERTTLTGNIGVLMPRYNIHRLMDKYGVEDDTVVATGATYKDAGSPTRPPKPEHDVYWQSECDAAFAIFKQVVSDGRKNKLKGTIDEIANGKAYNGKEAYDLGLVDEIDATGYLDSAIKYATTAAGLSNPTVVRYHEPPPSLLNMLTSNCAGGHANAGGVTINIDASAIDRMTSPQMMYLFRGE
jgi:protease-4